MGAARKKKKSLYDKFYGDQIIDDVQERLMKNINKQLEDYTKQIDAYKQRQDVVSNAPNNNMNTLDQLREQIRRGAMVGTKNSPTNPPVQGDFMQRSSYDNEHKKTPEYPVINQVQRVKEIEQFTTETHIPSVQLKQYDYYNEQVFTKIVGMEDVDWWEYVLIYGFVKALKISYEHKQLQEYIKNGVNSTRTVTGQKLEIVFKPRKTGKVERKEDMREGKIVIKESGTVYESAKLNLEIPLKKEQKTEEYRKGYFLYEDTFNILVVDYDALNEKIEGLLKEHRVHESLVEEIKTTIKNGRLSAV